MRAELAGIANPVIMSALGVSVTYAVAIRAGRRRPHPRHWEALVELGRCHKLTIAYSIVPTLAKDARMGQPMQW
jgi:hypothetical protein